MSVAGPVRAHNHRQQCVLESIDRTCVAMHAEVHGLTSAKPRAGMLLRDHQIDADVSTCGE